MACSYQQKARGARAVLLLDEVGLAEHSPDMPLKVRTQTAASKRASCVIPTVSSNSCKCNYTFSRPTKHATPFSMDAISTFERHLDIL